MNIYIVPLELEGAKLPINVLSHSPIHLITDFYILFTDACRKVHTCSERTVHEAIGETLKHVPTRLKAQSIRYF